MGWAPFMYKWSDSYSNKDKAFYLIKSGFRTKPWFSIPSIVMTSYTLRLLHIASKKRDIKPDMSLLPPFPSSHRSRQDCDHAQRMHLDGFDFPRPMVLTMRLHILLNCCTSHPALKTSKLTSESSKNQCPDFGKLITPTPPSESV